MRKWMVRAAMVALVLLGGACSGERGPGVRYTRTTSPDGQLDALLWADSDCGVPCSLQQRVALVHRGDPPPRDPRSFLFVAEDVRGLSLRWRSPDVLEVAYEEAEIVAFRNRWSAYAEQSGKERDFEIELRLAPTTERSLPRDRAAEVFDAELAAARLRCPEPAAGPGRAERMSQAEHARIATLRVAPDSVVLRGGESFPLDSIRVNGFDSAGRDLGRLGGYSRGTLGSAASLSGDGGVSGRHRGESVLVLAAGTYGALDDGRPAPTACVRLIVR